MALKEHRRALLLGGLLLALAGLVTSQLRNSGDPLTATDGRPSSKTLSAFMAEVVTASKIKDPLERCLRMPDLPGSHWHAEGVAAYCRYRYDESLGTVRFRELIAAGKGDEVDRILEGYLDTQMHDPAHAGRLDEAMYRAGFSDASPATRAAIDDWKRQRPESAFAVAASGLQYLASAYEARGYAYASETSDEQWAAARKQALKAKEEFDRATTMTPLLPSVYTGMLNLGSLVSDEEYVRSGLELGLAIQPGNAGLRLTQIAFSGRKWGGSKEKVEQLAEETAKVAPKAPLLWVAVGRARLEAITDDGLKNPPLGDFIAAADEVATGSDLSELARLAQRAQKNDEALIIAAEALRFDNSQPDALYIVGWFGWKGQYRDWAKATLEQAAADNPESGEVASYAGAWLRHIGDPSTAERLLLFAREHDPTNDWSLSVLGDFYSHEGKNYPKAADIAEELIRRDPNSANGYVIRACVQMDTNHPDRYTTLHAFLDRFGNDPEQQHPAAQMRAYLAAHPEPGHG